jgi:hypothetical protein
MNKESSAENAVAELNSLESIPNLTNIWYSSVEYSGINCNQNT